MKSWDELFATVGLFRGQCYGSKSAYRIQNPICVFIPNAFVCSPSMKVWGGDLDLLTADASRLMEVATSTGLTLYVLRETHYPIDESSIPDLAEAIVTDRAVTLTRRMLLCLPDEVIGRTQITRTP